MDTSEYMPMFLAEAQEHLESLTLAVVRLEENPADRDTVDEIFRMAHSIKGMSATMGFARLAELTHAMEDVFELLRQRRAGISREAVDTLLACVDALSGAIESVAVTGSEELDPAPLVDRLRSLVWARTPEQLAQRELSVPAPDLHALGVSGERVLHVVATLSEAVLMPAVRAHMVLAALTEHGELLLSAPRPDEVEQFRGQRIEAWLVSEHEEDAVRAKVSTISDVQEITVAEVDTTQVDVGEPVADVVAIADDVAVAPAPAPAAPVGGEPSAPAAGARSGAAARTVRVDAERLDALMHSMGELVIHRTSAQELTAGLTVPGLQQAMQELTRSSQSLQALVMQVRMIPVEAVFLRLPRLVRDLATQLGKEVKLELRGSETELDRTVVDALGDPLVHLVRNALDHGLEPASERLAAGKEPAGTLRISARHSGSSVVIEVLDDGRGIDPARVARKALAAGLIDAAAAEQIDLRTAVELLFRPGFSTAETTTDISGRGVGMDAVRDRIRDLGGEVSIESEPGQGTVAQVRLPLTLAIVAGLLVEVGGDPYAVPLDRIERTLRLDEQTVRTVTGRRMLILEDGVVSLVLGTDAFGTATDGGHAFVVIVRTGDRRVALAVDALIGQRELVTRPLPGIVSRDAPVSGGAALADGRIALIVDCDRLDTHAPAALGQLAA